MRGKVGREGIKDGERGRGRREGRRLKGARRLVGVDGRKNEGKEREEMS